MLRFSAATSAIAAIALFSSAALAQEQDLPVAAADEIIFVGEAPAPPGTEVTIEYLAADAPEIRVCATAVTTPTGADAEISSFVFVVEASCAFSPLEPRICWDVDLCHIAFVPPGGDRHEIGDTVDLGRLEPQGPPEVSLPIAGGSNMRDSQERLSWLLWAGVVFMAVGLVAGGVSLLASRRA